MSVISFRLPDNIGEWKVQPISTTLLSYNHENFPGEILLSKTSATEIEVIYVDGKEDVADSFYIPRFYNFLEESLADILSDGFQGAKEKAKQKIIDMIQM